MVFLSPWLVGMLGLGLIPTVLSLYFAFTDYTGAIWPPTQVGVLQVDPSQRSIPQVSAGQIRPREVGPCEIGILQDRPWPLLIGQIDVAEVAAGADQLRGGAGWARRPRIAP
jgi:ABC-type sugar transport system permease subunit